VSSSGASETDPVGLLQRDVIDRLCLEFEDLLRSGAFPRIESFLERISSADEEFLLSELLAIEWDYLTQAGGEVSVPTYLARFPNHHKTLHRLFVNAGITERTRLQPGGRIGRYEIRDLIGQGSFGVVYLGWDSQLERHVAIKEAWVDPFEPGAGLERSLAEARSIAQLQHPGIVSIHDIVDDEHGLPLIVMEYVDGPVLLDAVRDGSLTSVEFLRLLIRVAEAVDFAHQRGYVHRDLKPGNIRLDARGEPRILDFGLAMHESVRESRAGESAGSLAYMSPEQVMGNANWLDGRADIWALGVMMYEVLAERSPFGGSKAAELAAAVLGCEPKPIRQICPDVPSELERICLKCLRKPPAERYSTAGDMAEDLRRFLQAAEGPALAERPFTSKPRSRLGAHWRVAVSLVVAGSLLGLGWMWQSRPMPLDATIDVQIWDPGDGLRRGVSIRDVRALPVRPGDQVRLNITVNRPAFAYIFWIDSQGKVNPVYPWEAGDWRRLPKLEGRVDSLRLPAMASRAWTVAPGPAGMETITILLCERAWQGASHLDESQFQLRPQIATYVPDLMEWRNGQIRTWTPSGTRSADLSDTVEIADSVAANQFLLQQRLDGHFPLHYALSFPYAGVR